MKRAAIIVAVVATLFGAVLSASASANRACQGPLIGPSNARSLRIGGLAVYGMGCGPARSAIHHGTFSVHGACFSIVGIGACTAVFRTPGFACGEPSVGVTRCWVRRRGFRFGWRD